jgi:outer membrane protein OmpA-like peptidoglycan-associated protein
MQLADVKVIETENGNRSAMGRCARICIVAAMASILGACSTMDSVGDSVVDAASAMNPLNWFDDDDEGAKTEKDVAGTTETTGSANTAGSSSNSGAKRKSVGSKSPSGTLYGDNRWNKKTYPKLGTIPDKANDGKTLKRQLERKKLAKGLVADTKNAQYTEQVLKARLGVTPPPPVASPTTAVAARSVNTPRVRAPAVVTPAVARSSRITPPPAVAPPAVNSPRPVAPRVPPSSTGSAAPRAIPVSAPIAPPRAQPAVARVFAPPRPAVPAPSVVPPPPPPSAYQRRAPSEQFATPVGRPQAQAQAQAPGAGQAPSSLPKGAPPTPPAYTERPAVAPVMVRAVRTQTPSPQVASLPSAGNGRALQVATIYFRNGSSRLGAQDRSIIRDVVAMYRETGGAIRIVGHSSGIAASQGSGRSKLVNFKVSLDRANSVAVELIRHGVPPDRIDVVAEGAGNPRYAEYAPTGEAGNRRAEVYLDYTSGS